MVAEMVDGHPWGSEWMKKVAMAAATKFSAVMEMWHSIDNG